MFNNSSNIDASRSTFSEIHRDQYYNSRVTVHGHQTINTVVHGDQIIQDARATLEILQKASATSAAYNSAQRYPAPKCQEGTRVELLARLVAWLEDVNEKPICWLNGRPGSGKSAISQTIAEKYAGQQRLAASFFFSRRDFERRTTQHFFPTIATQLLSSIPSIRPAIVGALEDDCMLPTKVLREQMQKLLLEPISKIAGFTDLPTLIIVDALDECDNERLVLELVSLLVHLLRNSSLPFRLLITSRTEPWLQAHFQKQELSSLILPVEIQAFDAQNDIRLFLQHALDDVYEQNLSIMGHVPRPWPPPAELDHIVRKASGLFIFAMTVVKFVGDRLHNPVDRLQAILEDRAATTGDSAYADLDALYRGAVSVFHDADVVRLILGVVYCMSVPISISALHKLLRRPGVDARVVIPALSSVLLASQDNQQPIQFYHASFRDFLVSPQRSLKFFVDPIIYHRLMAQLCFEVMNTSLKPDMCDIGDPSRLNDEIEDLRERREAVFDGAVLYACRYWAHHLSQVPDRISSYDPFLKAMQQFCTGGLIYWIEALSILSELESAIMMLQASISWIKVLQGALPDMIAMLEDAERLVMMYMEPISQSALHVYHTAVAFAPPSSVLSKTFKHEAIGTFTIIHNHDPEWHPYRRAIHLHKTINAVAFSPSGDTIATAGVDQGVQLWNSVTGGNIASLGDHTSTSLLVCYSPSGAFVAAAFEGGTVGVWDPSVGRQHFRDEDCHTKQITCLEFSPDSAFLASASQDHSIQLWSTDTAQRLHRLDKHEGPVSVLAFSSSSQLLCSGSKDNLVIIWDTQSGKSIRGLIGHRGPISSVAISRDCNMVASGSEDQSVKVWDLSSGKCTRTFSKGTQSSLRSVKFLDDDRHIVSASDNAILLWDVTSRSSSNSIWSVEQFYRTVLLKVPMLQTRLLALSTPTPLLRYALRSELGTNRLLVAFSPRSPSFAFSSGASTFCGTLPSPVTSPPLHSTRSQEIVGLAISPDGSRVASTTSSGSLEILDPTLPRKSWEEIVQRVMSAPLLSAEAVLPSPDGERYLVNSFLDWFLADRQFQVIKKLDFGFAVSSRESEDDKFMFCADGSTFVSAVQDFLRFDDKTSVRVFGSASGQLKAKFPGLNKIFSIEPSHDGSKVACGQDGGIQLCEVIGRTKRSLITTKGVPITALSFSHDALELASGSKDGTVRVWDVSAGTSKVTLDGGTSTVTAIAFSPGSRTVIIGHEDGCVRLWCPSTSTSHELAPSGQEIVKSVDLFKFSDDGRTVTCRDSDGTVTTWALPEQLPSPSPDQADDQSQAVPHLLSQADKSDVFDCLLRSKYVLRADGWVYEGKKRLFWLPDHLRPSEEGKTSFIAFDGRMVILSHSHRPMFLTLNDRT